MIISKITEGNRLSDGCFGKIDCLSALSYLFSTQMPNSCRKISLEIWTLLKKRIAKDVTGEDAGTVEYQLIEDG